MSTSNSPTNRYGSLASEIYDIDKPLGKLPDTAFYLERLSGVRGEILEPGCGSGRAMVPLLDAGHSVTGFDLSDEMLAQCRARCRAHGHEPDLSRQDFSSFRYDRSFAAAIIPAGTFTLIREAQDALALLRRLRESLASGGLLMVDLMSLALLARNADDRRSWTAPDGDLLTLESIRTRTDWIHQVTDYSIRYERWRDNRLVASQLEPMTQRYWGVLEFRLALETSGFDVRAVTPDYRSGAALTESARVLTFEAAAA
ncbi:class I SAM-dependent methyltransferase [Hyphomonas sp.]|uniref:class I SAM-dependent methyltransferase n=1 Tax=Hyphomonas sp. TaxID=87 RepID=UPI003526E904